MANSSYPLMTVLELRGSIVVTFLPRFRDFLAGVTLACSFNNSKRHMESVNEKARDLGVYCFETKLFCLVKSNTGTNYHTEIKLTFSVQLESVSFC